MLQSCEKNIMRAFKVGLFDNSKHELYKNLIDTYNYGICGSGIVNFYDDMLSNFFDKYKSELREYCHNTDCLEIMEQGGWFKTDGNSLFSLVFDNSTVKAKVVQGIFYELAIKFMESEAA